MDYQYPVFFECAGLDEENKKRIKNYFSIKRKSGGGECGLLKKVNDQVYKISFKDEKAQHRILQQSEHVLKCKDGPLVLTVRGSLELHSSSPITTWMKQKKALRAKFKEVKDDFPDCPDVPSELKLKLESKANEMNQGKCRPVARFVSGGIVHLVGPSSRVDQVMNELDPLLDSLCQEEVTSDSDKDFGLPTGAAAPDTARGATARDGVQIEIVEGLIETQQVNALVSPMVDFDPLSTRVGNTLKDVSGSPLLASFHREAGESRFPGDAVLVDLPGLPANSVFFLNLLQWDNSQDGTAVQVLRQGFSSILASCDNRGIGSIAVPAVGTGVVLRFPNSVAASVLLEEVHAFDGTRTSTTPFLVRFVIHPSNKESGKAFQCAQEALERRDAVPDQELPTRRIVVLGKTGAGKSSLLNAIFGENLFTTNHSANAGTSECQAETRSVNGKSITMIDTPGVFDPVRSDEDLKSEIVRCITECAPGPHAFLIVLKVEKFTDQEKDVIAKISQVFSEEAFKFSTVVFTHGDQLHEGMKIDEFVSQNEGLRALVGKCGGRCHVIDNTHWKVSQGNDYRSNTFQVKELLNTIDKMVIKNNGGCYTNEMLQIVDREIQKQEALIQQSCRKMSPEEIRNMAKKEVSERFLIRLAGTATGAVFGALLGVASMVLLVIMALQMSDPLVLILRKGKAGGGGAAVGGEEIVAAFTAALGTKTAARGAAIIRSSTAGKAIAVSTAALAGAVGAVAGGVVGYEAAEGAESVGEAAEMASKAVLDKAKAIYDQGMDAVRLQSSRTKQA